MSPTHESPTARIQLLHLHNHIVIRYASTPDEDDPPLVHMPKPPEVKTAPPDPEDPDPPDAVIIALLDHPEPWQNDALTLRGAPGSRDSCFRTAKRCQLRDLYAWVCGKYPGQVQVWRVQQRRNAEWDGLNARV